MRLEGRLVHTEDLVGRLALAGGNREPRYGKKDDDCDTPAQSIHIHLSHLGAPLPALLANRTRGTLSSCRAFSFSSRIATFDGEIVKYGPKLEAKPKAIMAYRS